MGFVSTLMLAIGLAMDAFAVSISTGISIKKSGINLALKMAFFFGLFQALMPIIGFYMAGYFYDYICHFDHWIAFFLLSLIGGKMILEAVKNGDECETSKTLLSMKELLLLSFATSIDALAAGVSLSFLCTSVFFPAFFIGLVTFSLSFAGVVFGKKLGCAFGKKMEIIGGVVLIILGLKIFIPEFF